MSAIDRALPKPLPAGFSQRRHFGVFTVRTVIGVLTDTGVATGLDVAAEPWIAECRPPEQHSRVRRIEPAATGVVHARQGEDFATRTAHGSSAASRGATSWLDDLTPVRPGVERWVGAPWVWGSLKQG